MLPEIWLPNLRRFLIYISMSHPYVLILQHVSSNINEVLRAVLNSLFFFSKKSLHAPKVPKAPKTQKAPKEPKHKNATKQKHENVNK